MTLDEVVSSLESDFTQWATGVAMAKLIALFPFLLTGVWNSLAIYFVEIIVKEIAKQFDYASYYTYKTIKNNLAASAYEDAMRATRDAAEAGDSDAYNKAKQAQISAFINVWALS